MAPVDITGGYYVKAFTASATFGPSLVWSNQAAISTVDRSAGVTVTWTGGPTDSYVRISGFSSEATAGGGVDASFTWTAPASAGQFSVPPAVCWLDHPP
jgi:hypothetical protein